MIMFLRVLASFAIVGVLLWFFARVSAGKLGALLGGGANGKASDPLAVLDRRQLTRNTGIAVVRAGSRHVLVGISDAGVQLLGEGDDLVIEAEAEATSPSADMAATAEYSADYPRTSDHRSAGTRFFRAKKPAPARMNVLAALREMTVRRS